MNEKSHVYDDYKIYFKADMTEKFAEIYIYICTHIIYTYIYMFFLCSENCVPRAAGICIYTFKCSLQLIRIFFY